MKGTTNEVGNDCRGNVRYDRIRISRGKHRSHVKILKPLAYTEEPHTNDNYFISKQDDLLGSLGMGKYVANSEHSFEQSHCYANFSGIFLHVGSKITEMTHMERKDRLIARRGRGSIWVVGMPGEKFDG